MTYRRGDNRKLINDEAHQYGWIIQQGSIPGVVTYTRRESNIMAAWTERDTVTYASINVQDTKQRIPAAPRMALIQIREWLSAPGEESE